MFKLLIILVLRFTATCHESYTQSSLELH